MATARLYLLSMMIKYSVFVSLAGYPESVYGSYTNVYICPQREVFASLAHYLVKGSSDNYSGPSHYHNVELANSSSAVYSQAIQLARLMMNVSEAQLQDVSVVTLKVDTKFAVTIQIYGIFR